MSVVLDLGALRKKIIPRPKRREALQKTWLDALPRIATVQALHPLRMEPPPDLPDEILSSIFEEAVKELERTSTLVPLIASFLRSITLVCRRWYRIATVTLRLWTHLSGDHNEQVHYQLCLERSGATPLIVSLMKETASTVALLGYLHKNEACKRVRSFDLSERERGVMSDGIDNVPFFMRVFQEYAWPILESLAIGDPGRCTFNRLLDLLEEHRTPSLRFLYLEHVRLRYSDESVDTSPTRLAQSRPLEELNLMDMDGSYCSELLSALQVPKLLRG